MARKAGDQEYDYMNLNVVGGLSQSRARSREVTCTNRKRRATREAQGVKGANEKGDRNFANKSVMPLALAGHAAGAALA